MKRLLISLLLVGTSFACNQAKFGGDSNKKGENNQDQKPQTLVVTTPSDSVKAGKNSLQATAAIKESPDVKPDVTWSIDSETADKGTIDENGLYTSPEKSEKDFPVTIVATLKSNPNVKGSKTITVVANPIFHACTEGSQNYPIVAEVYQMNPDIKQLPNYDDPNQATHKARVCMENYAVEPRNFQEGFPKVENLFEYFSLRTSTTLIVPQDGTYTFELNSDDGSRLYIDGSEIINNDGEHQAFGQAPDEASDPQIGLRTAVIYLTKGEHKLELNYFQGPRYRIGLMLKWQIPGSNDLVYVPKESFK